MSEWSREAVEVLIGEWRGHECLYRVKSKFYHNKLARYTALESIREKLPINISCKDIQRKLSSLRSHYAAEWKQERRKQADAGPDEAYPSTLWWYPLLHFLRPEIQSRKVLPGVKQEFHSELQDDSKESSTLDMAEGSFAALYHEPEVLVDSASEHEDKPEPGPSSKRWRGGGGGRVPAPGHLGAGAAPVSPNRGFGAYVNEALDSFHTVELRERCKLELLKTIIKYKEEDLS